MALQATRARPQSAHFKVFAAPAFAGFIIALLTPHPFQQQALAQGPPVCFHKRSVLASPGEITPLIVQAITVAEQQNNWILPDTIATELAKQRLHQFKSRTVLSQLNWVVQSIGIEWTVPLGEQVKVYANSVHFGRGIVGIRCASWYFFRKAPPDLSVSEIALLAALPKGPLTYDPIRRPERAKQRRDGIIDQLAAAGAIDNAAAATAKSEPLLT